jgi:hypothetical protein
LETRAWAQAQAWASAHEKEHRFSKRIAVDILVDGDGTFLKSTDREEEDREEKGNY